MKKIIDRKLYDTDRAILIHEWTSGTGYSDFNHYEEKLYVTEKVAYFLAGSGGANTKYRRDFDNGSCSGEDISVMSVEEAIDWLEQHDGAEAIEKFFSSEIEEA